jgi:hypothetical protein
MSKRISISVSDWVYDQYLKTTNTINKSKYIEEMFVKGVNSELGELQGIQAKAINLIKEVREKDEIIANFKRELASVKSKVLNQEQRRVMKQEQIRRKATAKSIKKMFMAEILESDMKGSIPQ